jgi:ASC-1-like (ASCH) protein
MHHELKIWPEHFENVRKNIKNFEIRFNDKNYQVGDTIQLNEWTKTNGFTGRKLIKVITYITSFEQRKGWVVFAIKEPNQ